MILRCIQSKRFAVHLSEMHQSPLTTSKVRSGLEPGPRHSGSHGTEFTKRRIFLESHLLFSYRTSFTTNQTNTQSQYTNTENDLQKQPFREIQGNIYWLKRMLTIALAIDLVIYGMYLSSSPQCRRDAMCSVPRPQYQRKWSRDA